MEHNRKMSHHRQRPRRLSAAIYAGRANLQPIEYCGLQTVVVGSTQTTIVEDSPGYPEGVDANPR